MRITITSGKTLDIDRDENLLQALKRQGTYLIAPCGGKGICGKCRLIVSEGKFHSSPTGKLSAEEVKAGIVLACRTYPESDITVVIPKESQLVVGDVLEVSRVRDLLDIFRSSGDKLSPLVTWCPLSITPPSINNNASDLERLKNALESAGLYDMQFSHAFLESLSMRLREAGWTVRFGYREGPEALFIKPASMGNRYGLAVDIGTTTIVAYLVNLREGTLIDIGSTYNSQIRFGDDVITRIVYATESGGLTELRDAVISDLHALMALLIEKNGGSEEDIESIVIAGNTTMSHLFWGLNPQYIREEPYIPTLTFFPVWKGKDAGLRFGKNVPVYTIPCAASYVGGDIVAGVLASQMHTQNDISLFMDIGTNGEIVIGNKEWLVTAACSAGPCFEGSGIRHGMRATEGAVESVAIDPQTLEPTLGIIGSGMPIGICGSGMIDAITELFLSGIIDRKGRFVGNRFAGKVRDGMEGPEFILSRNNGREIVLTQVDIENILRAKAAIYAGVSLLIKKVGLTLDAIERIYIAGGFGNCLNIEKSIILGMLPDVPREKFRFLGNTAIAGACLCLLSGDKRAEAQEIASKMTNIELSVSRTFMDEYLSALFLPHTDISLFPTVETLLKNRA